MTAPKAKNLVSGTLAESITTSTTNILVTIAQSIGASGIQAFFPTPPFYITIMPKSPIIGVANRLDSEIMLITAVSHDQVGNAALTATRAQRDTTAKAFGEGDIVTVGSYCDDAVFLDDAGTSAVPTPWINAGDIIDGSITSGKIDNDSYEITDQAQHTGGTNQYYVKRTANIVCIKGILWINGSSVTTQSWITLGKIPQAISPSISICSAAINVNGNNGNITTYASCMLTTDGTIQVKVPTANTGVLNGFYISLVYII